MTIAIGLISKHKRREDGKGQIVLACESETTFEIAKNQDAQKLHVIEFQNGKALAVYSQSLQMGDAVIDIMQRRAKDTRIDNAERIAKVAEDSMRELRTHLQEINKGLQIDWRRYFWDDYPLDLLIAYFFDGNPYLYALNIDTVVKTRVRNNFIGIGIGKELAEFILREYNQADPDFEFGDVIATAVIEKVKDNVKGCGGQTWLGVVEHVHDSQAAGDFGGYKSGDTIPADKQCYAFIYRRKLTDSVAAELKEQELILLPKKKGQMLETLVSLCKKIGPLVYLDYDEPDGGNTFRMSLFCKTKDDESAMLKKFTEERFNRKKT